MFATSLIILFISLLCFALLEVNKINLYILKNILLYVAAIFSFILFWSIIIFAINLIILLFKSTVTYTITPYKSDGIATTVTQNKFDKTVHIIKSIGLMLACAPIFSILIALFLGLILTIFGEKGSINAAFGFLPIVVGMYTFIPGIILLIIGIFLDLFSKNK